MRSNVVFLVLVGLLGVLGISLAMKSREPHAVVTPSAAPSAGAAESAPAMSSSAPAPASGSAAADTKDKGLGHPLRVSGLGWELVAPILLVNGGVAPKKDSELGKAGLEVAVDPASSIDEVEKSLARGGADEAGADVAVLPLSSFVAAFEHLSALRPVVFFAGSWSRGRDVVSGKQALEKLPATGEVALKGEPGSAATTLALFALELAGVSLDRVRVGNDSKAVLTARSRASLEQNEQRDVLLGTAQASRLVPMVAICSASLVEQHSAELSIFIQAWLEGATKLNADPAASARAIAEMKDAPEPILLLGRLGEVAPIGLGENAELMALSGRSAVTIDSLFQRSWRLLRDAKLVSIPAPERAPIATSVIAKLVRSEPGLAKPEPSAVSPKAPGDATKPILIARVPGPFDVETLSAEAAFVAEVFHRAPIRLSATRSGAADPALTDELIGKTRDRYGLGQGRLTAGKAAPRGNSQATLEILPLP